MKKKNMSIDYLWNKCFCTICLRNICSINNQLTYSFSILNEFIEFLEAN